MVRRYDEVIEVQESSISGPTAFLWRNRVYVVRAVLGHWRERRAWWLEGATARLLGLEETDDLLGVQGTVADGLEREVWRVEATSHRGAASARSGAGPGVYDLGRDDRGGGPDRLAAPRWLLIQVSD